MYLSAWGIMKLILGAFLNILRNSKHSLDILHENLDTTRVVTTLRNVLGLTLLWAFFGVFGPFCSIFLKYYFSSEKKEFHLNYWDMLLRYEDNLCIYYIYNTIFCIYILYIYYTYSIKIISFVTSHILEIYLFALFD